MIHKSISPTNIKHIYQRRVTDIFLSVVGMSLAVVRGWEWGWEKEGGLVWVMSRRVIGERFRPIVRHDSTEVEKLKKEVEDLKRAYDDVLREKPCVKNCGTEVCLLENLKGLLTDKVIVRRSDWERLKERSSRLTTMENSLNDTEKLAKKLKSEVDGLDSSFKM